MEGPMAHAELKERLGLHALGALEPGDAAELEAHLQGCRECDAELASLRKAAAELARAAGSIEPPAQLTSRILEAARAEPQLAAVRNALEGSRRAPRAASRPGERRRSWRLVAAAAAVAALIAGLVAAQIRLQDRLDRANELLARGQEFLALLASPEATTIPLTSTDRAPDVRAFLVVDRASGHATLVAFNVPPPPPGRVYQLWEISEGVHPVATLSAAAAGGLLHAQWSPPQRKAGLFVVTLEPESSGPHEPTGEVVLLGGSPPPRPQLGR